MIRKSSGRKDARRQSEARREAAARRHDASRAQPFAGLSPDAVLDAATAAGFECDGRLFALNSYENRVYQMGCGEQIAVLKFYRPHRWTDAQILEEHTFTAELAAAELPVAAPLSVDAGLRDSKALQVSGRTLLHFRGFRFAIFPWMRGRAPELDAADARQILGRALARFHAIGATRTFRARLSLDIGQTARRAREVVLASELLPSALQESYSRASSGLLERIDRMQGTADAVRHVRLHGDCHLGNLLWSDTGPVFVDLDDCIAGPVIQDLWMLLSGPPAEQRRQWEELLEGYAQFADFDFRELTLVEPLRAMRMLHHSAWVVQRWHDPAFPRAFPWFGEVRYWEQHIRDLLEQLSLLDEPPLLSA